MYQGNKCTLCGNEITPGCDFNQGRCPHRPKETLTNKAAAFAIVVFVFLLAIISSV